MRLKRAALRGGPSLWYTTYMNLRRSFPNVRRHFSNVRASTLFVVVAVLLSVSSVSATFYALGKLNAQEAETRIIREDLSAEQAQRLADAEQRVRDLALRDKRIAAQTVANRQLILALRDLIERRPDLFVGANLPPVLREASPIQPRPNATKPKPTKPKPTKPKPENPGPTPRNPDPAPTPQPPAPQPPAPQPPFVPPTNPTPPPAGGVTDPILCLSPLTCDLAGAL